MWRFMMTVKIGIINPFSTHVKIENKENQTYSYSKTSPTVQKFFQNRTFSTSPAPLPPTMWFIICKKPNCSVSIQEAFPTLINVIIQSLNSARNH